MKIVIDAFGGDEAPLPVIKGASLALEQCEAQGISNLSITFAGHRRVLEQYADLTNNRSFRFLDTPSVAVSPDNEGIELGDDPHSPIRIALNRHARKEFDAVVSAGSTGAQVIASILELGKCRGITRPAVGSVLPTQKGLSFILDVGASLVASSHHLVQFAAMGLVYAKEMLGLEKPAIGVLNVGEENSVGDRTAIEAHSLLSETGLNYCGFIEGRDIPKGKADVIVTNGFIGNILLKYTEGLPALINSLLPESAADVKRDIFSRFDYQSFGGEPLLGVKGVSIICHGSSSERAIASGIMRAIKVAKSGLHEKIESFLVERFDSYFSRFKYLRSFKRPFRVSWGSAKKRS